MTRKDIEGTFRILDGRIRDPGFFEGESIYVPHYHELGLDGLADADRGDILRFRVLPADRQQFPELRRRMWVSLWYPGSGGVREI